MEDGRRRAFIKVQTMAKKNLEGGQPPKPVAQIPLSKKRSSEKSDRPPKKPKVTEPTVGTKFEAKEMGMLPGPGKGKGLIKR